MQDEVNQEDSEQNEVDPMKNGADDLSQNRVIKQMNNSTCSYSSSVGNHCWCLTFLLIVGIILTYLVKIYRVT